MKSPSDVKLTAMNVSKPEERDFQMSLNNRGYERESEVCVTSNFA